MLASAKKEQNDQIVQIGKGKMHCLVCHNNRKLKQCFQRKTMSSQPHAYCSLLCHNGPSIISKESMHIHNFGQTLNVVTVNIRSRLLKSNELFSVSKQCKFGAEKPTGSEDRAQKRVNLQFL